MIVLNTGKKPWSSSIQPGISYINITSTFRGWLPSYYTKSSKNVDIYKMYRFLHWNITRTENSSTTNMPDNNLDCKIIVCGECWCVFYDHINRRIKYWSILSSLDQNSMHAKVASKITQVISNVPCRLHRLNGKCDML